jgi:hypothetical protein
MRLEEDKTPPDGTLRPDRDRTPPDGIRKPSNIPDGVPIHKDAGEDQFGQFGVKRFEERRTLRNGLTGTRIEFSAGITVEINSTTVGKNDILIIAKRVATLADRVQKKSKAIYFMSGIDSVRKTLAAVTKCLPAMSSLNTPGVQFSSQLRIPPTNHVDDRNEIKLHEIGLDVAGMREAIVRLEFEIRSIQISLAKMDVLSVMSPMIDLESSDISNLAKEPTDPEFTAPKY